MVIRNDFELVADGDQLNQGYYNDIYNTRIKKFVFVSAAEESTASTSWVDIKTGTLTPDDSNNILLAAKLECELKTSTGSDYAASRIIINNGSIRVGIASSSSPTYVVANSTGPLFDTTDASLDDSTDTAHLLDSSYTVDVQLHVVGTNGDTAYIKNVTATILVLQMMGETKPAFS